MKLSADLPIDTLELLWAMERRSARYSLHDIAAMSGRLVEEWREAFDLGDAPLPADGTIAQRFAIVRRAWLQGFGPAEVAVMARAPGSWCIEVARRLPEFSRKSDA